VTTEIETTQTEVCDNAYEATPVSWWGWPDETLLADFVEKNVQVERADQPIEDNAEYAILCFVS
jgi:hypothetical protein